MKGIEKYILSVLLAIFVSPVCASPVSRNTICGNALRLDGYMDYVRFPDSASFVLGTTYTYEFWYKADTLSGGFIFNKWKSGYEDKQVAFDGYGKLFNFSYRWDPLTTVNTVTAINVGTWYHFAVTYSNNTVKMYIDGVLNVTATRTISNIADSNGAVYIGRNADRGLGNNTLDGVIDEFRFYNRALSAAEVLQSYNDGVAGVKSTVSRAGLQAEWSFDEGAGTTVGDSSGKNNTGTFGTGSSAPTWEIYREEEPPEPPDPESVVPEPSTLILLLSALLKKIWKR
ncbi:MAG: LamG domain-containing protein [Candidatus Auribacterota bacterium]|nr:LamG domain-containing protein [Candidatus Auribacterota bacterium]